MVAVLVALGAGACAVPLTTLKAQTLVVTEQAQFTLRSATGGGADVEQVRAALQKAPDGLARWGGLAHPVTVNLLASRSDLEAVVRRDYRWLRAWARFDDVMILAPSTWAARDDELDQLVLHELTHCLLFQRTGTREDWAERDIPLWFREGMALWTAKESGRLPTLEDSARWLASHPGADLFADGESLAPDHFEAIYGLSHHAFAFLVQRYGAERVNALLAAMQRGHAFDAAFNEAFGFDARAFQRDFTRWLQWRGFRGWGHPLRRARAQ